ncbi:MAG: SymE family type I addiction module toxin [Steroidobacteraceae bacterium]
MGYLYPYAKPNYASPTAPRLGPEPTRVPFLRLQGRWLEQAGFAIGTPVRILVTPGRLVLEVDDE